MSVGNIILDFEGVSIIDSIGFENDSFTITMSANQSFKISSAERRHFSLSPANYSSIACPASKSTLTIEIPGGVNPKTYTITPGAAGSCSVSDGGSGGGGEVAPGPAPAPAPAPTPTPEPAPPPEAPPAPPPAAPIASVVGEGIVAIGGGAIQIVNSVSSGAAEIFRGITTGTAGSAYVARCTPNAGSFKWDTSQPILTDSGTVFKLTDGNNYKIKVIHCVDASLQDASDAPFSLSSSPVSRNFLETNNGLVFVRNAFAQPPQLKILSPNGGERWIIGQTYFILWESHDIPETNLVSIILIKGVDLAGSLKLIGTEVNQTVEELRINPEVTRTVKEVAVPAAVTVTAVSAGAITVTASAGSVTIAINLSEFLQALSFSRFYLLGLLRFRRKKPWGKVIDKLSGKPIQSATVQIYDAEFNKLKDSQITDAEGRFNAFITPGKYYILVSRKGYEPYQAGGINISSPDQILALEIYLSPAEEQWSVEYIKRINVWNAVKRFMELINPYLLVFGTLVSVISAVIVPNALNYVTLGLYILFDILKIYFAAHLIKPFGRIIDEMTNEPLSLAVVRIFEENKNWLLATKVTDEQGRFNFLLAPGQYYLTCSKAGYATFRSDTILVKKDVLPALNVKIAKVIGN